MSSAHGIAVRTWRIRGAKMALGLLSQAFMNDEEMLLAKEPAEAEPRTTDAYDSIQVDDDEEIELADEDILFEIDERD